MDGKRKYQVFISSTYTDMREERQAAVEAVLMAGHIPAGMELFAAGDETQLEVIKRWIDDSDIYVLILGARYGSIEPISKLSYTEVEYNYAVERKPYCALVLTKEANVAKQAEAEIAAKYETFRKKVLTRISSEVNDCKDIKLNLLVSINDLERRHKPTGWVRASEVAQPQAMADLAAEVTALRAERDDARQKLLQAQAVPAGAPLATIGETMVVPITYDAGSRDYRIPKSVSVRVTWAHLFALFGTKLQPGLADEWAIKKMAEVLLLAEGVSKMREQTVDRSVFETIRIQLEAYGFISVASGTSVTGSVHLYWNLTDLGKQVLLQLRAVRQGQGEGPALAQGGLLGSTIATPSDAAQAGGSAQPPP
jgi:hypothetical protein